MVAVKSPLLGMQMEPDVALYVAVLERQVLGLTINELKFRALLELLTGEEWDDMKTEFERKEIEEIAVRMTEKKLGIKNMEARKIVRERMESSRAASDLNRTS